MYANNRSIVQLDYVFYREPKYLGLHIRRSLEQFLPTIQQLAYEVRVYLNCLNHLCEAFNDIISSNADAI